MPEQDESQLAAAESWLDAALDPANEEDVEDDFDEAAKETKEKDDDRK